MANSMLWLQAAVNPCASFFDAFMKRVASILGKRSALSHPGAQPCVAAIAVEIRTNPPPVEALTSLLGGRVRADRRYRQLVIVWSTLRAGERDGWRSSSGYELIPEQTLRAALNQLRALAVGRSDPRLGLLGLQMTRRIAELTAEREEMEARIVAARERQAPGAAVTPTSPPPEPKRRIPASGFPATEPMELDRESRPSPSSMEVVLMTLHGGDRAKEGGQLRIRGFSVMEVFDREAVVDFRDTEPFDRPPPDEQELMPSFDLLPMA